MPKPLRIYVAGPYRASTDAKRKGNIAAAVHAGRLLTMAGFDAVVPHVISEYLDPLNELGDDYWLERTMRELHTCDAVATLHRWTQSEGAYDEVRVGHERGMTVASLDDWLSDAAV